MDSKDKGLKILDEQIKKAAQDRFEHYDYDLRVEPIEYVIDGFQSLGITIVAGQPGVGKTSLLVPLYLRVAHLCPDEDDLKPTIRRKVVYVSEDPSQVNRILVGMREKGGFTASVEDYREFFIMKRARRLGPSALASMLRELRDEYSMEATSKWDKPYTVRPLIVLDTANATMDIENENDNSEVGKFIAAIKGEIGDDTSLVIVAHAAKAVSKSDVKDITPRGASAWMGDANGTQYVINVDGSKNARHLILGKHRFEPDFSEIRFVTACYIEELETPQGTTQRIPIRYATAHKSSQRDRMTQFETTAEKKCIRDRATILEFVQNQQDLGQHCSRKKVEDGTHIRKEDFLDAVKSMIEEGDLVEESNPQNPRQISLRVAVKERGSYSNRDDV